MPVIILFSTIIFKNYYENTIIFCFFIALFLLLRQTAVLKGCVTNGLHTRAQNLDNVGSCK